MKTIGTFLFLFFSFSGLWAQTCCKAAPDAQFASLSKEKDFRDAHPLPKAIGQFAAAGKIISFPVAGGNEANAYLVKTAKPSDKYLFVFQEWWGLNDNIKAEADRLFKALGGKVNVLAIDLYDGKVATTRAAAAELMQAAKGERCSAIISGALTWAGNNAKIATIGWCFGGGWSLQASIIAGQQSLGCVMYYGMPESEQAKLGKLQTDVLAIYATEDKWITKKTANDFEANMKTADKKVRSLFYEADHAFCNPSNPGYNEKEAKKANTEALNYLKEKLK
jgi:carboxymethylenebutenolidase